MKVIKRKILFVMMAAVMVVSLAACGKTAGTQSSSSGSGTAGTSQSEVFPKFKGTDFDGNEVDDSLFAENEATILNFWFNGCSACVNEMPALESFNAKLREKGAELIGVNVQAGESKKDLDEAKEILAKQGVTYRNIIIGKDQDARKYIAKIFSFPTTIIVDKNGNIIGDPILGNIEDEKRMNEILKIVDDLKSGKDASTSGISNDAGGEDKAAALLGEENNIFYEHKDVWDKVFSSMDKTQVSQSEQMPYVELLRTQIEATKDSFSEDELNTLNEDLKKIEEIESKIQELNKKD